MKRLGVCPRCWEIDQYNIGCKTVMKVYFTCEACGLKFKKWKFIWLEGEREDPDFNHPTIGPLIKEELRKSG
jgi:hypothetical protein